MASRITRFTDVYNEPVDQHRIPIKGYEDAPNASLEDSLKPVAKFFDRIEDETWTAKQNCQRPKEGLNQDESASIHLYTMQFHDEPSLFQVLNEKLRAEERQDLRPWFMYLKLFLTALCKLPSHAEKVWRGVRDIDLSSQYPRGKTFFWWGISSCTTNLKVLESNHFLGKKGKRTLFSIDCQNGKFVALHSYFKNEEEEIILMPGSYFQVISLANPEKDLHIIHIKEIEPPFPTVARLMEKIGAFPATVKSTSAKKSASSKTTSYEILVTTGDQRGAGTDSQVYITLFGNNGQRTEKLHLKKSETNNNPFERNQTDKFRVKGDYLGELVKLRIEHDNTGLFGGWFLNRV